MHACNKQVHFVGIFSCIILIHITYNSASSMSTIFFLYYVISDTLPPRPLILSFLSKQNIFRPFFHNLDISHLN